MDQEIINLYDRLIASAERSLERNRIYSDPINGIGVPDISKDLNKVIEKFKKGKEDYCAIPQ